MPRLSQFIREHHKDILTEWETFAHRLPSAMNMLAEFRALRASVISLWWEQQSQVGPDELEEMTRFNEAIDQAIADSISRYT